MKTDTIPCKITNVYLSDGWNSIDFESLTDKPIRFKGNIVVKNPKLLDRVRIGSIIDVDLSFEE
jgi:hypothetical protein